MPDFFITGATGMVGSNLVRRLVKDGYSVRILIRDSEIHQPLLHNLKVEKHKGDLKLVETLASGMRGCKTVIHCAGMISYSRHNRENLYEINRSGTENMLMSAMAANVDRFIHTSSTAAIGYSRSPRPLTENAEFKKEYCRIAYMHSKWLAEEAVRKAKQVGFDVTIVCPSTIYGKGDIKFNNGKLFADLLSGRLNKIPPGGNGVVAVDDVVQGILLALKKGQSGERYILNTENITYSDFFEQIAAVLGIKLPESKLSKKTKFPLKLMSAIADTSLSLVGKDAPISPAIIDISYSYRYFSSKRAKEELGWQAQKPINEALGEAVDFYRQNGLLS